jgi:hypothetical protein
MWATVTPDPQNSLPVKISNEVITPSNAVIKVQMPNNFNGNYIMLMLTLTGNGNQWAAGSLGFVCDNIGTDITPLALFPTGVVGGKSSAFYTGNGASGVAGTTFMGAFAFSTIAQTEANNSYKVTVTTPGAALTQKACVWFLPLDNDITDTNGALSRFLTKNKAYTQLAKLLSQANTACASSSAPPELAPCEAASAPSRNDSVYSEPEYGILERSVHIDRAALEALLLPNKTPRLER